jgi:hypothetical protein
MLKYKTPSSSPTGFEAVEAFSKEMPNQFIINTVGTKYVIAS